MLTYDLDRRGKLARYDYLYRCIREDILAGRLTAGEKLPSKRSLASHLQTAVITVQNAYAQLEAEGYLYTVAGKGSFAAPQDGVNRVRRDALLGQFDSSAAELLFLGMTAEELTLRLRDAALRQARREEAGQ